MARGWCLVWPLICCVLPAGAGLPREALATPVPGVEKQRLLAKASLPRKH